MSKKKTIINALNLDLLCRAFTFSLVNWGSSSAWIGAYFLLRIEKKKNPIIRHVITFTKKV